MRILGIESSADETAAAVIEDGNKMLSNVIASSMDMHKVYGGIVPEIAARSHLEVIIPTVNKALEDAETSWKQIDAIGVTYGPGLGGSLLIGVMTARSLAIAQNKSLYAINHVQAHPYAAFITEVSESLNAGYKLPAKVPEFPILTLSVSGGHTQLAIIENHGKYKILGQTADDAVGEAFDKVAKLLGLPFPGGPSIAATAKEGDPLSVKLPIARTVGKYDFSFSGPKTAVLRAAQAECGVGFDFPSYKLAERLNAAQKANLAASFQYTAVKTLVNKTLLAYEQYQPKSVIVAGGVAANTELRTQMDKQIPITVTYPDINLCTDNAAMIASLAYYQIKSGQKPVDSNKLSPVTSLEL